VAADPIHERLLTIVKSLPETEESWPWGSIHCKIAGKIFVGWGRDKDGIMSLGFRTNLMLQSMLVASDPRFTIAKYTGKYGGLDMRLGPKPNWDEVRQLIVESYKIVAPKRLAKKLEELDAASKSRSRSKSKSKSASRSKSKSKSASRSKSASKSASKS
jgi:predicted DNA-binding protein (MmcQ/YjbR family)